MSAIAGPSRLPFSVILSKSTRYFTTSARRYAEISQDSSDESLGPSQNSVPIEPEVDDVAPLEEPRELTREELRAQVRDKKLWQTGRGFARWKRTIAPSFERAQPGQRARWLGGSVPFPLNPSFRPPPPLSNDLQDLVYRDIQRNRKNVSALSAEWSISKARIEAIRKIKEVEAEFKRQNLPLQQAFQNGMQPLLGVQSAIDPRTRQFSERLQREEALSREVHPSSRAELEEEQRWDAGIGATGAFGDPTRKTNEGLQRTIFEWRDEDDTIAAVQAEEDARSAAKNAAQELAQSGDQTSAAEEAETIVDSEHFPTPRSGAAARPKKESALLASRQLPETVVKTSKQRVYRFIDTSTAPSRQPYQVKKAADKRAKNSSNRSARTAVVKGGGL